MVKRSQPTTLLPRHVRAAAFRSRAHVKLKTTMPARDPLQSMSLSSGCGVTFPFTACMSESHHVAQPYLSRELPVTSFILGEPGRVLGMWSNGEAEIRNSGQGTVCLDGNYLLTYIECIRPMVIIYLHIQNASGPCKRQRALDLSSLGYPCNPLPVIPRVPVSPSLLFSP